MGVTLTDVLLFGKAQSDDVDNATLVIYRRNIMRWSAIGGYLDIIVKGVAPLSLPDAIANSLQYVKAFGGTEQRNLPDGYTQRQYIYMMAGSYVKVEDLLISAGYRVEFEFQTLALPTPLRNYIGGRANGMAAGGGFRLSKLASGGSTLNRVVLYGFENGTEYYDPTAQFQPNTRYKYTYTNGVCTLESGGSVVSTRTFTVTDTTSTKWGINSYVSGNDYWQTDTGEIYVYSVKVWNDQDELVMNLVPVIQQGTVPVVGLYDTVTGGFLTAAAGTFAAGPEAVPTPDAPMDIVSNNGVLKYGVLSTNLLDLANCIDGYYYTPAGEYTATPNARLSNYIPVKAGDTYTVGLIGTEEHSNVRINLFDTAKNWLSQTVFVSYTNEKHTQSITPAQDGFLAFSANFQSSSRVDWNTAQVVQGSYTAETMPEYEPYREGIYTDGTVETINAIGKNLFDLTGQVLDKYIDTSGNEQTGVYAGYKFAHTALIPVKPSTQYTLSISNVVYGPLTNHRIMGYDASGIFIAQEANLAFPSGTAVGTRQSVTFTTGATTHFLVVNYIYDPDGEQPQLELGSTATDYAPYYNGGTATTEMLLKVGNYQDEQEILSGAITRNVGVLVLDGTEGWTKSSTYIGSFFSNSIYPAKPKQTGNPNVLCSHGFKVGDLGEYSAAQPGACYWYTPTTLNYKYDDGTATVAQFTQWLADQYAAGTPVIVLYPLATPTTESVAGQTLQVTDGDNVLEITQASLDGLELEAKYKAAVSLTIQEVQDANLDPNVEVTIN